MNNFAAACYDQNSIEELEDALQHEPDIYDMKEWGLSESEWVAQIKLAIRMKKDKK